MEWVDRINHELLAARAAREAGNQGMARVCARRAAGWSLAAWQGLNSVEALVLLKQAIHDQRLPAQIRYAAQRLCETVGVAHNLPEDWDLIADAERIVNFSLKEEKTGMEKEIVIYGTTWCGDTRRARRVLDEHQIAYKWIDIDVDETARRHVEEVNNGFRSVPTIEFPDGTRLVEPSTPELKAKLGIVDEG